MWPLPNISKLMHYYVAMPSFQHWLFLKLPITFIAFIVKDNGNNTINSYPNDIHFLLSNGKPSSEPNITISFTKGFQTVSQKITKHHLIPLFLIPNWHLHRVQQKVIIPFNFVNTMDNTNN
jgi:hypothetical protein